MDGDYEFAPNPDIAGAWAWRVGPHLYRHDGSYYAIDLHWLTGAGEEPIVVDEQPAQDVVYVRTVYPVEE